MFEKKKVHEFAHVAGETTSTFPAEAVLETPEPPAAPETPAGAKQIKFRRVDAGKGDLRLAWTGYSREFKGRGPFEASEVEYSALALSGRFEEITA